MFSGERMFSLCVWFAFWLQLAAERMWAEAVYWAVWAGACESVRAGEGTQWAGRVAGVETEDLPGCVQGLYCRRLWGLEIYELWWRRR